MLHPCRSAKCVRPAPRSARTPKRMTASQPAEQGAWNYSSSLKDFHGTPKGCKPNYTHPIHYPQTDGCEAKVAPVLPDWQCTSGLTQKAGTATSDRALAEQGADARHLDFQGKAPASAKRHRNCATPGLRLASPCCLASRGRPAATHAARTGCRWPWVVASSPQPCPARACGGAA